MTRVYVICEGQTEEMFVGKILSPSLSRHNVFLTPSLLGKPGHKGGNCKFDRLLKDMKRLLLDDRAAYCTMLVDFYGLPSDFPGKKEATQKTSGREKSEFMLKSLSDALEDKLGKDSLRRFIPYVQMHEFEALLFSDVIKFSEAINKKQHAAELEKIRSKFSTPEDINDSPETAPGKRILKLIEDYEKVVHGSMAAETIGFESIRKECPLFDEWIKSIIILAGSVHSA